MDPQYGPLKSAILIYLLYTLNTVKDLRAHIKGPYFYPQTIITHSVQSVVVKDLTLRVQVPSNYVSLGLGNNNCSTGFGKYMVIGCVNP